MWNFVRSEEREVGVEDGGEKRGQCGAGVVGDEGNEGGYVVGDCGRGVAGGGGARVEIGKEN